MLTLCQPIPVSCPLVFANFCLRGRHLFLSFVLTLIGFRFVLFDFTFIENAANLPCCDTHIHIHSIYIISGLTYANECPQRLIHVHTHRN